MPVNAVLARVVDSARLTSLGTSASKIFRPVRVGERGVGSERTAGAKRAILAISRDRDGSSGALDGTIAVYGADLPHPQNFSAPVGNAYAQAATATSVRPQSDQVIGDASTTAFTTAIDLASGDLAAAIAAGKILVEMPKFKLTGTFTVTAAGAITGSGSKLSAGVTNALGGGEVKVGDTVEIGGVSGTITAVSSDTAATWDQRVAVASSSTGFNTSKDRRFRFVVAASAGATGDPEVVEASVTNSKLVLTFKVAPPKQNLPLVSTTEAFPAGVGQTDPGAAYLVDSTEVLADAATPFARTGIRARGAMWVIGTASAGGALSKTQVSLEHVGE